MFDGVETRVLESDHAQQLGRNNAVCPDIYFTLLDAAGISPTLVPNQKAKTKMEETGSLSKYERQKLQG